MDVADFDFTLPDELIAQQAAPRGTSRLLAVDRATGGRAHLSIGDLPSRLAPGDLLVVNNTRVFAARLLGHRVPSGGAVECLLFGGGAPSAGGGELICEALMHPGQKLKPGAIVRFEGPAGSLRAEVLARHFRGRRTIRLTAESGATREVANHLDVEQLIDSLGHIPLPPYIKRPDTLADRERYQTVFARARGSIAAPTAGLHFTEALLAALAARGVERADVTLHVGYGTFKPVQVDRVEDHVVDPEPYDITPAAADAINQALDAGRRIIAVGTTTTRALEDAAVKGRGRVRPGPASATIFIHPGHPFRVIGGLLTNFHLPKSSLLMLVAAFAGREVVLEAYRDAVRQGYRFYSYGDAMLLT